MGSQKFLIWLQSKVRRMLLFTGWRMQILTAFVSALDIGIDAIKGAGVH